MTPLKAIREKCLDCTCDQPKEVKLCPCDGIQSTFCSLYPYRFGKGPKREITEAQRRASADNLQRALHTKNLPEK